MIELIILSVLLNSLGQIIWRVGAKKGFKLTDLFKNPLIIVGLGIYALSAFLWINVLSKAEVSYAVPFISLGYVITAFLGWFLL